MHSKFRNYSRLFFKVTKCTEEHSARIGETYFTQNGSFNVAVQRNFAQTLTERKSPSRRCIIKMIKRFPESGTATDKERPERTREQHDVKTVSTRCYRCSRESTDVNKVYALYSQDFYWIITPYHESLETSSIQN